MNNNTRIAKNTIYLYIRTLVVMFVSLYTSRLVLQALGVEDMGIYNVVGGIVALMGFLQNAQTKATSRFITYELGRSSDEKKIAKVFSQCMTIHVLLAVGVIIIGETIGLYIVNNWTSIPPERWFATQCVYQFAILTFCIHIIRVPYDSVIVAHEDMSIYAYMSVIEAGLQLLMAWMLTKLSSDNLILYSELMMLIALVLFICYMAYVKNKRKAYRFRWTWNKKDCMQILSFSGWTLLGAGANTATQQGVNLLFNNFIGLIANAAMGLAGQVNIAVGKFINGFSTAFTPQIIKYYAQHDYNNLHRLLTRASKFSFALCYFITLPLIVNMDFVLHLWLGDSVPQYTSEFCRLILICAIIDSTTGIFNTTVTATGKIKAYQICISISFLLDLLICFLLFIMKLPPIIVFGSRILTRGIINMFIGMYFTQKNANYRSVDFYINVIIPIFLTILITTGPLYLLSNYTIGWNRLFITGLSSVFITGGSVFFIIMEKSERVSIINIIKKKK